MRNLLEEIVVLVFVFILAVFCSVTILWILYLNQNLEGKIIDPSNSQFYIEKK